MDDPLYLLAGAEKGGDRFSRGVTMTAFNENSLTTGNARYVLLRSFDRLFRQSVKRPNGCIEWAGSLNTDRYGQIWVGKKVLRTHRLAFEICIGPIPCLLQVLHHCDNRRCINPEHLFLGTNDDNIADRIAKGRPARSANPIRPRGKAAARA